MSAWHRQSIFGPGKRQPLDREHRARFLFLVRLRRHPGDDGLSSGHQKVAEALVRLLGTDGRLDPSHDFLARLAAVSVATVKRALERLRRFGLLTWECRLRRDTATSWRAEQTSNAYALTPGDPTAPPVIACNAQIERPVKVQLRKKEAPKGANGALAAMLEAARGLPDLLKARRDALEMRLGATYGLRQAH